MKKVPVRGAHLLRRVRVRSTAPTGSRACSRRTTSRSASPRACPTDNLKTFQTGAIYDATAKGECIFGEVFTTDGRIVALDLKVLEDDRNFFPKYNVSLVLTEEVAEEYPQIADLIAPVAEKLTDEVLLAAERRRSTSTAGSRPTSPGVAEEGRLRHRQVVVGARPRLRVVTVGGAGPAATRKTPVAAPPARIRHSTSHHIPPNVDSLEGA